MIKQSLTIFRKPIAILIVLFCTACSTRTNSLSCVQLVDQDGFTKTIRSQDHLREYEEVDFCAPQPYKKAVVFFQKEGTSSHEGMITTYHDNGQLQQRLEIMEGAARGLYEEWYENGNLRLSCFILGGIADISEEAYGSYIFDGCCRVFYEDGTSLAQIHYKNGHLSGPSIYYFPSGLIERECLFEEGKLIGRESCYFEDGTLAAVSFYQDGMKEGEAFSYWSSDLLMAQEIWSQGKLIQGNYWDPSQRKVACIEEGIGKKAEFLGTTLHKLVEYRAGKPKGKVELFDEAGYLLSFFHHDGSQKEGVECFFYPGTEKLHVELNWHQDRIHGMCRSWYENGVLESQRLMANNEKNGLLSAWYEDGSLMLIEEYERDRLLAGEYFRKGEKLPVSSIKEGVGLALLFDGGGLLLEKVSYYDGRPVD